MRTILYNNKRLIASSLLAGSYACLAMTGEILKLPFMVSAATQTASIAALISFGVMDTLFVALSVAILGVLPVAALYALTSVIAKTKPADRLFTAKDMLVITAMTASTAALVIVLPQVLLLAGAGMSAAAAFVAHPAMQFFLPALLLVMGKAVLAGVTTLAAWARKPSQAKEEQGTVGVQSDPESLLRKKDEVSEYSASAPESAELTDSDHERNSNLRKKS